MAYNATNQSFTGSPNGFDWTVPALTRCSMCVIQTLLNAAMIVAFIVRRELRTSFTIYLMFLFCANIIYALGGYPLEVLRQGFPNRWFLSHAACAFYIYQVWVFCPVAMHLHVLITLNRLWAISFPVSYKNIHSEKVAVLICAGTFVYVHLVCLPLVVLDLKYHHLSDERYGCMLNTAAQNVYTTVVAIVSTDVPIVVVVGAYPFLWYKHLKRKKIGTAKPSRVEVHQTVGAATGVVSAIEPPAVVPNVLKRKSAFRRIEASSARPFVVLTLLTVSVLVCWTPDQVMWTMSCFNAANDAPGLRYTTSVLFTLQAALDPILFALSLRTFRKMLSRLICCCKRGVNEQPRGVKTVISLTQRDEQ
ncbi:probable G-protein coupled receptor No18 [Paramacrobiotus metropolitanus]|uniref:probable G-protein coupled receptor No18 n=1 Tax=Paramacrobiotus metropolitanus TaxID=2943436 RepID=UPI0024460FBE|nr:probable G-protein coupled receptor No18 [Paramacrobiotus metropolitanus]